jgi:hypothetical protein
VALSEIGVRTIHIVPTVHSAQRLCTGKSGVSREECLRNSCGISGCRKGLRDGRGEAA